MRISLASPPLPPRVLAASPAAPPPFQPACPPTYTLIVLPGVTLIVACTKAPFPPVAVPHVALPPDAPFNVTAIWVTPAGTI